MPRKKKLNKNLTDNATSNKSPTIDELFKQEEKYEFDEKYKFIFSNDEILDAQRMQEIESYSDSIEIDNKTETLNYIILEEKKNSNENNVNIDINVQQKPIFKILNKKLGRRKKKKRINL